MMSTFTLYCSNDNLIICFNGLVQESWYEITSINDQDKTGKLYGSEILLFEEPDIDKCIVQEQFKASPEVRTFECGQIYLYFRKEEMSSHAPGFGRKSSIGIVKNGKIAVIRITWNSLRAGTPYVDRHVALSGLEYIEGEPDI